MTHAIDVPMLNYEQGGNQILAVTGFKMIEGSLTMLLGPNGAGKTTLLRCLAGQLKVNSNILVFGKPIQKISMIERSKLLQWVPSKIDIPFDFSVGDILLMGRFPHHQGFPKKCDFDRCQEVADQLGISSFTKRLAVTLSQGEFTRMQIARALVCDAKVILLDEPCASLDIKATHEILGILQNLAKQGITILMSHHDLYSVKRHASHILMLKKGEIKAHGPVENIFVHSIIAETFEIDADIVLK